LVIDQAPKKIEMLFIGTTYIRNLTANMNACMIELTQLFVAVQLDDQTTAGPVDDETGWVLVEEDDDWFESDGDEFNGPYTKERLAAMMAERE
jgi:hypothetical protein